MTVNEGGAEVRPTPPVQVVCPNCNAGVGEKCTAPTDISRRPLMSFHYARITRAEQVDQEKAELAVQVDAATERTVSSDRLNRRAAEIHEVIERMRKLGVPDYAYTVTLDDRLYDQYGREPHFEEHIHRTYRDRSLAIEHAIKHYNHCAGKYDVFVGIINLTDGTFVGNVLSLSALGPEGTSYFDNL